MTAYERGFLTKCAEYGVDGRPLLRKSAELTLDEFNELRKLKGLTNANPEINYAEYKRRRRLARILPTLLFGAQGAIAGGIAGQDSGKAALGALAGGGFGALVGAGAGALGIGLSNAIDRNHLERNRKGLPASWWAT